MKHCRKCGAELVVGENWHTFRVKKYDYICIECANVYQRQYRKEHQEKLQAYSRRYREKHREKLRASDRQRNRKRKEWQAEYNRQYRKEHREELRARDRQRNRERMEWLVEYGRQWYAGHPDKARASSRARTNCYRARKYNATIEPVDEEKIYELYNHTCIYCGAIESLTIDHVVPLNGNGLHSEDNLVAACRSCNCSKSDKPLIEWLRSRGDLRAWVM